MIHESWSAFLRVLHDGKAEQGGSSNDSSSPEPQEVAPAPAPAPSAPPAQPARTQSVQGQPQYSSAEYEAFQAANSEKDPQTRINLLGNFVSRYPKSVLIPYVDLAYVMAFIDLKDYSKAIGYADKYVALPAGPYVQDEKKLEVLHARVWLFGKLFSQKYPAVSTTNQLIKERDAALLGEKMLEAFPKPEDKNVTDQRWQQEKASELKFYREAAAFADAALKGVASMTAANPSGASAPLQATHSQAAAPEEQVAAPPPPTSDGPQTPASLTDQLLDAIVHDNVAMVRRLIDVGADVNRPGLLLDRYTGRRIQNPFFPLELAATGCQNGSENQRFAIVKMLVDAGANVNAGGEENAALSSAAYECSSEVFFYLTSKGAVPKSQRDKDGELYLAATAEGGGRLKIVDFLLAHGANIDAKNDGGYTPLSGASLAGNAWAVERLLDLGADIEATDKDGRTPLIVVVSEADEAKDLSAAEMLQMLLNRGANVAARDAHGKTALDYALQAQEWGCVQVLEAHGARSASPASEVPSLFSQAVEAEKHQDWQQADRYLTAAFNQDAYYDPGILYNLGVTEAHLGHRPAAIGWLNAYISYMERPGAEKLAHLSLQTARDLVTEQKQELQQQAQSFFQFGLQQSKTFVGRDVYAWRFEPSPNSRDYYSPNGRFVSDPNTRNFINGMTELLSSQLWSGDLEDLETSLRAYLNPPGIPSTESWGDFTEEVFHPCNCTIGSGSLKTYESYRKIMLHDALVAYQVAKARRLALADDIRGANAALKNVSADDLAFQMYGSYADGGYGREIPSYGATHDKAHEMSIFYARIAYESAFTAPRGEGCWALDYWVANEARTESLLYRKYAENGTTSIDLPYATGDQWPDGEFSGWPGQFFTDGPWVPMGGWELGQSGQFSSDCKETDVWDAAESVTHKQYSVALVDLWSAFAMDICRIDPLACDVSSATPSGQWSYAHNAADAVDQATRAGRAIGWALYQEDLLERRIKNDVDYEESRTQGGAQ